MDTSDDLQDQPLPDVVSPVRPSSEVLQKETCQWAMLLHLSILAGFAIPFAGFAAPIVIWQLKKTELPGLDQHGKNAANWIISKLIYLSVSLILVIVVIGLPLLAILGLLGILFPIIAAVKASSGITWKYPLAIPFFK